MKLSRRAKRMSRSHLRRSPSASLNMVSLMDIFTILVFFLLVNSADVEVLPSTKAVRLPESVSEQQPQQALTLIVNDKDIIVQGRSIANVTELTTTRGQIPALKRELEYQAQRARASTTGFKGRITIMGDKEIPYHLLKRIMATCSAAQYTHISLAVYQKTMSREAL